MGPHPFPMIVRDFQSVISQEAKAQILEKEGKLPTVVMACVGGGSNAMGMFAHFIDEPDVQLIGCEAAGKGVDTALTAATINTGTLGVFHGMKSYFCQDEYGQIAPVYSISAGLDYPGTVSYTHLTTQGESDIELLHRYNSKHFIEVAIDCENKQNNDMKSLKDIALDMMKDSIQLNKNNEHID